MLKEQLRAIANELGVATGRLTKAELVRQIQRAEGNFDCFGSAIDAQCDQIACRWREECLRPIKGAK